MKRLPLFGLAVVTTALFAEEPSSPAPTAPVATPASNETKPAEPATPSAEVTPTVENTSASEAIAGAPAATTPAVVTTTPGESEPEVPKVAETGGPKGKKHHNAGKKAGGKRRGKKH